MYKIVLFATLLAVAIAAPAGSPAVLTYAAAPVAIAAAPIAYAAHAIPAPVAYHTGYQVSYEVEPVEQHGYSIKY